MGTRISGYYWVKFKGDWEIAKWEISWRNEYQLALSGSELYKDDEDFDEIDERRIERTEKAILPDEDYDPIPDNPTQYLSDNPYLCKPD